MSERDDYGYDPANRGDDGGPVVSEAAVEAAKQTLPEAWRPIVRGAIARAALAAAAPEIARAAKVEALREAARELLADVETSCVVYDPYSAGDWLLSLAVELEARS